MESAPIPSRRTVNPSTALFPAWTGPRLPLLRG